MKLSYLVKGWPGHPAHPPLTDATIGAYIAAAILGVLGALGVAPDRMATGWWLALVVGLVLTVPTATTGFIDWLGIAWRTPLWNMATLHMAVNATASVFFLLAAIFGYGGYLDGEVTGGALAVTLVGFGLLTLGGWLGGTIVYVHGMRVLNLAEEPAARAATPGHSAKEAAAGERPRRDADEHGRG